MWWLATTVAPRVTATVLLSSAPTARIGRVAATGSGSGSGASPRERRSTCVRPLEVDRTTESSQRMWMPRSWPSTPSTSGARRASASSSSCAIGSSLRLPLVITSGRPTPASRRWCSGEYASSTPEVGQPGGHAGGDGRAGPARRDHDRAAGRGERRDGGVAQLAQVPRRGEIGDHHRERLVVARLAPAQLGDRRLVGGIDGQVEAADALHRDDLARPQRGDGGLAARPSPARSALAVAASVCVQRSRGPQSGQALGCAWKRRSVGSSYSAWQAGAHREAGHRRGRPVVRAPSARSCSGDRSRCSS